MRRKTIFMFLYFGIFFIVSIPLILNIKINEVSNSITDLNSQILILEREKAFLNIKHSETFSISNIEKLFYLYTFPCSILIKNWQTILYVFVLYGYFIFLDNSFNLVSSSLFSGSFLAFSISFFNSFL